MSGCVDMPVHCCNRCDAVWIEDDQMYEEPDRCPHCGVRAKAAEWEGKRDELDEIG